MRFYPLQDRILIKRRAAAETSAGGILLPDAAQEKPAEGEVIAAGPGVRDAQGVLHIPDVGAGDTVLFIKWAGIEIQLDGVDYLILKETDILGILGQF